MNSFSLPVMNGLEGIFREWIALICQFSLQNAPSQNYKIKKKPNEILMLVINRVAK